jgi:putative FmdB family regulatory protein
MPLYEYECDECRHRFERIQKFSDPRVEICPKCGGKVHKLMSSPAIQFKGSGFYITDYAKKDSGSAEKSEKSDKGEKSEKSEKTEKGEKSGDSASADSKAEAKAESKSETKTETKTAGSSETKT